MKNNDNKEKEKNNEEKTSPFVLIIYGLAIVILLPILGTLSIFKGLLSMDVNEVATHPIEIILGIVFIIALIGFIVLVVDKKKK